MNLSCINLSYKINNNIILDDLSFELRQGDNLLILGPSGSGKTTLLCILTALLRPTNGIVKYADQNIYELSPAQKDKFRGQNLGIIFQNFHLINSLTVFQNIELAVKLSGKKIPSEKIYYYLEELNLVDKAQQKINSLSYGQAQRIALIRSFITKPSWIFCDEPTSALDDNNTDKLLNLMKNEAKENHSSLIVITHDQRVKSFFDKNHILKL